MKRRLTLSIAVAALVAAAGGACAWVFLKPQPQTVAAAPPAIVEHCRRAAELLYDAHWAAACFKSDQDNECMLPDAQAAKVNAILASEEARCMAAEAHASLDR